MHSLTGPGADPVQYPGREEGAGHWRTLGTPNSFPYPHPMPLLLSHSLGHSRVQHNNAQALRQRQSIPQSPALAPVWQDRREGIWVRALCSGLHPHLGAKNSHTHCGCGSLTSTKQPICCSSYLNKPGHREVVGTGGKSAPKMPSRVRSFCRGAVSRTRLTQPHCRK